VDGWVDGWNCERVDGVKGEEARTEENLRKWFLRRLCQVVGGSCHLS
jgi:hypothetical protein